jgi:hypothetical protein
MVWEKCEDDCCTRVWVCRFLFIYFQDIFRYLQIFADICRYFQIFVRGKRGGSTTCLHAIGAARLAFGVGAQFDGFVAQTAHHKIVLMKI